jgi:lipopolysaccharide/colanic/teichoic acid biosynthesis glycosyltransferase
VKRAAELSEIRQTLDPVGFEESGCNHEEPVLYRRWGKRFLDLVASSLGLVMASPLLVLCAFLARLTSRGPVFFRQVRSGQHGRPFKVFKFRTMRAGADRTGPSVVVPGDQRLTLIGNSLRRTKLDELPQLLNVLSGRGRVCRRK